MGVLPSPARISLYSSPEGRVTTPSSLPLAARKSRPSWLVPARVVEMANSAQRRVNSIRRWVIFGFCVVDKYEAPIQ